MVVYMGRIETCWWGFGRGSLEGSNWLGIGGKGGVIGMEQTVYESSDYEHGDIHAQITPQFTVEKSSCLSSALLGCGIRCRYWVLLRWVYSIIMVREPEEVPL
jgi:hypothetical protein